MEAEAFNATASFALQKTGEETEMNYTLSVKTETAEMTVFGIFLYREPVDRVQMFAFLLIWIGLVIFSFGELKNSRRG